MARKPESSKEPRSATGTRRSDRAEPGDSGPPTRTAVPEERLEKPRARERGKEGGHR